MSPEQNENWNSCVHSFETQMNDAITPLLNSCLLSLNESQKLEHEIFSLKQQFSDFQRTIQNLHATTSSLQSEIIKLHSLLIERENELQTLKHLSQNNFNNIIGRIHTYTCILL